MRFEYIGPHAKGTAVDERGERREFRVEKRSPKNAARSGTLTSEA
jgi:hypothetical protein